MRWLVVVLLLAGCEGCATIPYTAVLPLNLPQIGLAGQTVCDYNDHPVIIINQALTSNEFELQSVLVHERVHVTQIERVGNCTAFMFSYSNSARVRLVSEAEAYCAELQYRVNFGKMEREFGVDRIVKVLSESDRYRLREEVDSFAVRKLVKGLQGCRPDEGGIGDLSELRQIPPRSVRSLSYPLG